jgi:hypothetical protein
MEINKMIDTIEYKDYIINIDQDEIAENPRKWDNLGTMICFHNRYSLGDKHSYYNSDAFIRELAIELDESLELKLDYWESGNGWKYINKQENSFKLCESIVNKLIHKSINKHYIILPLYLYDHSGITISTGPFSCPWDSGQVGYIYVSIEKVKNEYKWKIITKKRKEMIINHLKCEVNIYDDYITGNVYGYRIEPMPRNHIECNDSCYGFYGNDFEKNGLLDEARGVIDFIIKNSIEERALTDIEEIGEFYF